MIAPSPVRDQGNPSIKASSCGRLKLIRCNSSVHTVGASVGEKISRVRVGVAKDLDDSGQGGVSDSARAEQNFWYLQFFGHGVHDCLRAHYLARSETSIQGGIVGCVPPFVRYSLVWLKNMTLMSALDGQPLPSFAGP